jgi:hypothetical protein
MVSQQTEERVFNKTFRGIPNLSNFNACVGNNGRPDSPEYASGFLDAALSLGKTAIKLDGESSIDELIYPIAFNMRHGVEVWLKHFLQQLKSIRTNKLIEPLISGETEKIITDDDLTKTHNINVFWNWFKFNSENRDARFTDINDSLNEYITDIGEIDPTGQTFRYPYNTESQKHLVNTPVINLLNLTKRIGELKELIEELHYFVISTIEEYATKTYTKDLSRAQVAYISTQLPMRIDWSKPEFDEIKGRLKSELSIGSKEYSEVLNIIQKHRTFAENIGVIVPLKSATKCDLRVFLNAWLVFHPQGEQSKLDPFKEALNSGRKTREFDSLKSAVKCISIQSQADLGTIFYLARDPKYSETYELVYSTELQGVTHSQQSERASLEYLRHFFIKTNFVRNMVISLDVLGQGLLLDELRQEYEVVDKELVRRCSK